MSGTCESNSSSPGSSSSCQAASEQHNSAPLASRGLLGGLLLSHHQQQQHQPQHHQASDGIRGKRASRPSRANVGKKSLRVANGAPSGDQLGASGRRGAVTNKREKWRQQNVNKAFVSLRRLVPTYPPDKRLSKNDILRMAIKYIRLLESILEHKAEMEQPSSLVSSAEHLEA